MEIYFFDDKTERFIDSHDIGTQTKIGRMLVLLERYGHTIGPPYSKKVSKDLFEIRIRGNIEVRIFYTFHRGRIVLLHGFDKKSQKIPKKEIVVAMHKLAQLV